MRDFLCFISSLLVLCSCNQNTVFNQHKTIPNTGWHKDSITHFKLPVLDSLKAYNLYINLRNSNTYSFSNLYLITQLNFPNGKQKIDTLEYKMTNSNGEWLGTGGTSIKENKLWYLEHFNFQEQGNYTVSIRQAMRHNGNEEGLLYLKGITDIGFSIEEITNTP